MPLIPQSSYRAPLIFRSAHFQTIYPSLFRKVETVTRRRERIETEDDDFLDLDWSVELDSKKLVILMHGLEGSSQKAYMQGMATVFCRSGWNVLSTNFRGCSGETNRQIKSYHSGATEELQTILNHVFENYTYDTISLVGFSLGGNLILKYLGDCAETVDTRIKAAAALSVPCDLASSSIKLEGFQNRIYMERFMRTLRKKIRDKIERFPGQLEDHGLSKMKTFREFDGTYTAPIHGFTSAEDYWSRASSKPVISKITIPTLMINAANDPFLTPACYPLEAAQTNSNFYLEIPKQGGHVGFVNFGLKKTYWSERRALEFVERHS